MLVYYGAHLLTPQHGLQAAPAAIVHLFHNLVFIIGYPVIRGDPPDAGQNASGPSSNRSTLRRIGQAILTRAVLSPVTISTLLGIAVVSLALPVPEVITGSFGLL